MDEEIDLDSLKSYSSPDVLICGNCRFANLFFSTHSDKAGWCLLFIAITVKQMMTLQCRMVFTSIHSMVSHKRHYCKLRFTCKCESEVIVVISTLKM